MSTPPKKPDFSNVQSRVTGTEAPRADFSNVQSSVTSSEETIHEGGGGSQGVQVHTVVRGDTLSGIAKHYYGKAGMWPIIFEANRDKLDNPDLIHPGQELKIPPLEADKD
ncbi:LysM peptidoglycan-binding domain-containing protein [Arenimonas sp.]|uniref:LysM peptidoglycan-binding domain-containing protein n=1 Tax=Arenimonas sp. TaxID=1872635 RepID=UPI0035ADC970